MTRDAERNPASFALAPGGTFSRSSRVRHRRDFTRIQSSGVRVRGRSVTVIAMYQAQPEPRLGCAISKRVGNAVVRNRIRRLIREIFRRLKTQLLPVDFVVVAHPAAAALARAGLETLSAELGPALVEAGKKAEMRGPRR